jgi:Tol biopolymer transport system component
MRPSLVALPLLLVCALSLAACERRSDSPRTTTVEGWQPPSEGAAAGRGLLIARSDGIALRETPDGRERLIIAAAPGDSVSFPRWSPDGRQIAYVATSRATADPERPWGGSVLVAQQDGGGPRAVFRPSGGGTQVEGIAWARDGAALYLALIEPRTVEGRVEPGRLSLERLDLASGARSPVVAGAAYPDVSPDGRSIAYLTYSSGLESGGLWVASTDGANRRRILTVPGRFAGLRAPRFSPDGARLAFGAISAEDASLPPVVCPSGRRPPWQPRIAEAHGPPADLWTVAPDGSGLARLADLDADDPALAWAPDGSAVAAIDTCRLSLVPLDGAGPARLGPGSYLSQIDWR